MVVWLAGLRKLEEDVDRNSDGSEDGGRVEYKSMVCYILAIQIELGKTFLGCYTSRTKRLLTHVDIASSPEEEGPELVSLSLALVG